MKTNNKVFISAPIAVDWSTVIEFSHTIISGGGVPVFWNRKENYDQEAFNDSHSVVFILPKNKFQAMQDELPIGLKSELSRAYKMQKVIYIGYITTSGNYNIYAACTDGKEIKGLQGTAQRFSNWMTLNKSESDYELSKKLKKASDKIAINSAYGAYAGKVFVPNPCDEIELPTAKQIYGSTIPKIPLSERYSKGAIGTNGKSGVIGEDGYDYDIRLLLML
jgi:hypothetical protein